MHDDFVFELRMLLDALHTQLQEGEVVPTGDDDAEHDVL
jgi:hypothetical protein